MTTLARQAPSVQPETVLPGGLSAWRFSDRFVARFLALTSFVCFFPYPALNVGNASALQIGNVLCLILCSSAFLIGGFEKPLREALVILIPLCLSAFMVALGGGSVEELDLSLKSLVVWSVSAMTLVATLRFASAFALPMLCGIAAATLVHAAIGVLQLLSFGNGEMPLAWLYVNRSFLSVQENASTIARYIQRPFGLFPEPSAMSSSLAPWVILFTSLAAGLLRLPRDLTRRQTFLFAAAALGGLGLIIVSRSGHSAILLLGMAPLGASWLLRARACRTTYLTLGACMLVGLPLIAWGAGAALSDRLGGNAALGNSSWQDRAQSLQIGFLLMSDSGWTSTLFGMGPGLSSPAIERTAQLEAVWSVLLTYCYEAGMVGAVALVWLGLRLMHQWHSTRFDATYASFAFVWLVGITLTTSYGQLLPIWIALGWLLCWPLEARRAEGLS